MTARQRRLRTGAIFVGSVVTLFVVIIIGTWSRFWERRDEYFVHFTESVAGLDVGSPLKINGVTVGRVSSINLDPANLDTVIVEVCIQGGLPIRGDAQATVSSSGLTGLKFIEVDPGTQSQPLLPPGSRIPSGTSTMAVWTTRIENITGQFGELQKRLAVVTDEESRDHIEGTGVELRRLMARVALLAREINEIADENGPELRRSVKNLEEMTVAFSKASKEVSTTTRIVGGDVKAAIVAGKAASKSISTLTERTKVAATSTRGLVDDAQNSVSRERLNETMSTLQATLQSMTKMVVSLQRTSEGSQEDLAATAAAISDLSQHLSEFSDTFNETPTALVRRKGMDEAEPPDPP